MFKKVFKGLLILGLLSGCSGKGLRPMAVSASPPPVARQEVTAHFKITIPNPPAGALKAAYISPATKSIVIALSGSTNLSTTLNVTAGQTYTANIKAFAGSNTFNVTLYDSNDGAGKVLSKATVPATLAPDAANNVPVTTFGVVDGIQLTASIQNLTKNVSQNLTLTVRAWDAASNTIVGNYAQTITVINSDRTGALTLDATTVQAPGAVKVTYTGACVGVVTFYASASGVSPSNVVGTSVKTASSALQNTVWTLAGNGTVADGTGSGARFSLPFAIAKDGSGNLYVADANNNLIRKMDSSGVVTTLAGDSTPGGNDGTGSGARFNFPTGITTDTSGNIYVGDYGNHKIRKITAAGVVTTLAGSGTAGSTNGTGTAAQFNYPLGVAVDSNGNVYVGDTTNNLIRKIDPSGVVTTYAGSGVKGTTDGTGMSAQFSNPVGVLLDGSGNLYVADSGNNTIRVITSSGVVSTVAGSSATGTADGFSTSAQFNGPYGLSLDANGNLYVADTGNSLIRKIDPLGVVTTVAGDGTPGNVNGVGAAAEFAAPYSVLADSGGFIYVVDGGNGLIRKIDSGGTVTNFAGGGWARDGAGTGAQFNHPFGVAVDYIGNIFVADLGNNRIRKMSSIGVVTTLAGGDSSGTANGSGSAAQFSNPYGVAVDTSGNVYVADTLNHMIRKITSVGVVTTMAGNGVAGYADGIGTAAEFNHPSGVAVDNSGNVYVADTSNHRIRKITPAGVVNTVAGSGAPGAGNGNVGVAQFNNPLAVAIDAVGNLYVADVSNNSIRIITTAGAVLTLAGGGGTGTADGQGTAAQFNGPNGVAVDGSGNVYVADSGNQRIRGITPDGLTVTLSGNGSLGFNDGPIAGALYNNPRGIAVDCDGNLYIGDTSNNRIRKIQ